MLMGKELSGTTVSGLDLVKDKHASIFVAESAKSVDELDCRLMDTGNSLDSLNDNRCKSTS